MWRGVRRPLCGHMTTASGGKRGGAVIKKNRPTETAIPLNSILESAK
jgi:hypothetical protein